MSFPLIYTTNDLLLNTKAETFLINIFQLLKVAIARTGLYNYLHTQ